MLMKIWRNKNSFLYITNENVNVYSDSEKAILQFLMNLNMYYEI